MTTNKPKKNGSARYSATIEKSNGGFVAQCIEIPGAIAQGYTKAETIENLKLTIDALLKVKRKFDRARAREQGKQIVYL